MTDPTENLELKNCKHKVSVVFFGPSYVGKSSLIRLFAEGKYEDGTHTTKLRVHWKAKRINDINVAIEVWDSPGREY